jgi:hypothetical protein
MSQWIVAEVNSDPSAEDSLLSLLGCAGEVLRSRLLSEEGAVPSRWGVLFAEGTQMEYVIALNGCHIAGSPSIIRMGSREERRELEGPPPGLLSTVASAVYAGATTAVGFVRPSVPDKPQFAQVGDGVQPQWGRV